MPKGKSYQDDTWLQFEKGSHNFVHENFAHEKAFAFKAKLQNEKDGVILKETLTERPDGITSAGEVQYWFSLQQNRSFYSRVGKDSSIEVQYDNGVKQMKGVSNNLYFGAIFNRTFSQRQVFGGLELFEKDRWSINGKLTYDHSSKGIQIDQKFRYLRNGWKLDGFMSIDNMSRVIGKCGLLIGYAQPEDRGGRWSSALRVENHLKTDQSLPKFLLNNATITINNNVTQAQTVGLESKLSIANIFGKILNRQSSRVIDSFWLSSEWRLGETTVKAKVSKDLSHAICIRNKLGNYGTYSIGLEANDFSSKARYKFGIKLDLTL